MTPALETELPWSIGSSSSSVRGKITASSTFECNVILLLIIYPGNEGKLIDFATAYSNTDKCYPINFDRFPFPLDSHTFFLCEENKTR